MFLEKDVVQQNVYNYINLSPSWDGQPYTRKYQLSHLYSFCLCLNKYTFGILNHNVGMWVDVLQTKF